MSELEPCPFCGGKARTHKGENTGLWFMYCPHACMDFCAQTEEDLIARWNTRYEPPSCKVCGHPIPDEWDECPQCGSKVI